MKNSWINNVIIVIFLVIFHKNCVQSSSNGTETTEKWLIPKIDGKFDYLNEAQAKKYLPKSTVSGRSVNSKVFFFLYTNQNPNTEQLVLLNNTQSLKQAGFNPEYPTRILIHGWREKLNGPVNSLIRPAYLKVGNYNVFFVDWNALAKSLNYIKARYNVETVGKQVAEFIDFLHRDGNMNFKDLIVIGHSLGAHVAGIAGENIKTGKISIIYGLDPAYPLFSYFRTKGRLSSDDAEYVEAIQTNAGLLGFQEPIGRASFYPNWGQSQKGCILDWSGACSHRRAYEYFAEAVVNNNFITERYCDSFDRLKTKQCNNLKRDIKMADIHNKNDVKGIYYVQTNDKQPFGLG